MPEAISASTPITSCNRMNFMAPSPFALTPRRKRLSQLRAQRPCRLRAIGSLLRLDVGVADDAADLVVLPAEIAGEVGAAHVDRAGVHDRQFRRDLGRLQRRGELLGEL